MSQTVFKAGAANCPLIFPEMMFPTDGFKGVHDAPYMGLVILDAGKRVALCSMELVNVPEDAVDQARKIISEGAQVPYENIWIHATHTITTPHAPGGPGLMPEAYRKAAPMPAPPKGGGPGRVQDPDAPMKRAAFIDTVLEATKQCTENAMKSFREAKMGVGAGTCDVNVNRDIETPFGWWIGLGGSEYSNKKMTMVRIDGTDGKPICTIMSYGVKPCAIDNSEMKEKTRLVCGDLTGFAARYVQEREGAPCLFFTPAAADQVPKKQAWYSSVDEEGNVSEIDLGVEYGIKIAMELGEEMGKAAVDILEKISDFTEEQEIRISHGEIEADARGRASMPKVPAKTQEFTAERKQIVDAELIAIGDLALVAVKPEVCARTEKEMQEASPFKHTLMMSMVNGGMKYMPDKWSYDRVTWEGQNTMLLPGTAEQWRDMVNGKLNELYKA